ncbi:hypothetical protein ES708_12557 [subsurface metagenome]
MTKRKVEVDGATRTRTATQLAIRKRFGNKKLNVAYRKLCSKCGKAGICKLVPLTTRGKNCPYFEEVRNATNNPDTS